MRSHKQSAMRHLANTRANHDTRRGCIASVGNDRARAVRLGRRAASPVPIACVSWAKCVPDQAVLCDRPRERVVELMEAASHEQEEREVNNCTESVIRVAIPILETSEHERSKEQAASEFYERVREEENTVNTASSHSSVCQSAAQKEEWNLGASCEWHLARRLSLEGTWCCGSSDGKTFPSMIGKK